MASHGSAGRSDVPAVFVPEIRSELDGLGLEHLVQRACLLATGPELDLEALPPEVTSGQPRRQDFAAFTNDELKASRENAVNEVEDRFLRGLMDLCAGNVSHAARHAGVPRSYLQRLLAKHRGESD